MGQYYYVINPQKKEYLHPHVFGNGLKLMEFGCSSCSTLTGLALLLADKNTNGRGGGDFYLPFRGTNGFFETPESEVMHQEVIIDNLKTILNSPPPKDFLKDLDKKYIQALYATYFGRWHGDSIKIVGDYGDEDEHGVNDYQRANEEYEDISRMVLLLIAQDSYVFELQENKSYRSLIDRIFNVKD